MKKTVEFDLNTMLLCGVLNAMTSYNYNKVIEKKLRNFISYLEDAIYESDDSTPNTDIIAQEYYYITTYKKENE